MILEVFAMVASAFAGFFAVYSGLEIALNISTFACIALALWSITRFLLLPILGGQYSINDGEADILSETVTETTNTADPVKHYGDKTIHHSVIKTTSRTTSRSSRRRVH